MKERIITAACGAALCFSLQAFAAKDVAPATNDSCHQKLWAQLNLTADQKAKLKDMRSEMQTLRKTSRDKMKDLRDKSRDELLKAAPSKTVLYGYAAEISAVQKAMAEHMADHMLKVKTVLTKEQFEKLLSKDFWKNMRKCGPQHGMKGGPGKGGMHDPGGMPDMDD